MPKGNSQDVNAGRPVTWGYMYPSKWKFRYPSEHGDGNTRQSDFTYPTRTRHAVAEQPGNRFQPEKRNMNSLKTHVPGKPARTRNGIGKWQRTKDQICWIRLCTPLRTMPKWHHVHENVGLQTDAPHGSGGNNTSGRKNPTWLCIRSISRIMTRLHAMFSTHTAVAE